MSTRHYKFLAIFILLIASLSACVAFAYDDTFCVTGYTQEGIIHFNEFSTYTSDEPLLFIYAGIIGLFFAILLSFTKMKLWFFALNILMLMFMAIPMNMFSVAPFYQVIYDSIFLCGHFILGITAVLFYLYWLFVAIYLLKSES